MEEDKAGENRAQESPPKPVLENGCQTLEAVVGTPIELRNSMQIANFGIACSQGIYLFSARTERETNIKLITGILSLALCPGDLVKIFVRGESGEAKCAALRMYSALTTQKEYDLKLEEDDFRDYPRPAQAPEAPDPASLQKEGF